MSSVHQVMTLKCQCTHLKSVPQYKMFKDTNTANEEYLKKIGIIIIIQYQVKKKLTKQTQINTKAKINNRPSYILML